MDDDVLTAEADRLKSLLASRGVTLPHRAALGPALDDYDYNVAVIEFANEFEGTYALLQDLKARRFGYEFSTTWNPFAFEYSKLCKPFFVGDVRDYGYDAETENCRCPANSLPCSLSQSLSDVRSWSNNIVAQMLVNKSEKPIEDLVVTVKGLKRVDVYGRSLAAPISPGGPEALDKFCKATDVVLCSVQGSDLLTTQWSDWSGCSSKCGPGTQERVRITYDGAAHRLVAESRACEIEACADTGAEPEANECALKSIPSTHKFPVVNRCRCPDEGQRLCSSGEAAKSKALWIGSFRAFCERELAKNRLTGVLQEGIAEKKRQVLGRAIKMEFPDGFYFDCSEHWGIGPANDLHIYCRSGAPVLCRSDRADPAEARSFGAQEASGSALELGAEAVAEYTGRNFVWLAPTVLLAFLLVLTVAKFLRRRRLR